MGRAIVREPKVFLFDEPLSNLDAKLRMQMRTEIKKLRERVRTTAIYVTHDQVEAMTLADRIVLMHNGRVEQIGTPEDVYDAPATLFVAGFIGASAMNFVAGRVQHGAQGSFVVIGNGARLALPPSRFDAHAEMPVTVGLRPEHLHWSHDGMPPLAGTARVVEPLGSDTLVVFDVLEYIHVEDGVEEPVGVECGRGPLRNFAARGKLFAGQPRSQGRDDDQRDPRAEKRPDEASGTRVEPDVGTRESDAATTAERPRHASKPRQRRPCPAHALRPRRRLSSSR